MTSPLSLSTLGMLSPAGSGGSNVFLTGGIEVDVNFEDIPVVVSLTEVAVVVSQDTLEVMFENDEPSPVGFELDDIAIST